MIDFKFKKGDFVKTNCDTISPLFGIKFRAGLYYKVERYYEVGSDKCYTLSLCFDTSLLLRDIPELMLEEARDPYGERLQEPRRLKLINKVDW